jgi:molybdate transport system substrate-binding protein
MMCATLTRAATLAAAILISTSMAQTAELRVLSSNAFKEAYLELVPGFEKATEHKVVTTWAGTNDILKRMHAGETYDLVIMAGPALDGLIKQGKIVAGSRVDLVKSGVGVAVRAGAPRPDISSGEALKRTLLAAKSVGYSQGPSGVYIEGLFQRLGIADALKPKSKQTQPGNPVGVLIARGEAEIGFQQISELLPIAGIDYLGPLPPDIQHVTVFAAGLHTGAKEAEAAKALVKFLTAPAAVPVIKQKGLEPG